MGPVPLEAAFQADPCNPGPGVAAVAGTDRGLLPFVVVVAVVAAAAVAGYVVS